MKKAIIILILFLSVNIAFANERMPIANDPEPGISISMESTETNEPIEQTSEMSVKSSTNAVALRIRPGDYVDGLTLDATGFIHGIEMNEPGTAWLVNSNISNANTNGKNGRGIVVTGQGAVLHILNTVSEYNSEDGYRVTNGGKMIIQNSHGSNNGKNGYFVGDGGTMELLNSTGHTNKYGLLTKKAIRVIIHRSHFFNNRASGLHLIQGEKVSIRGSKINSNNTNNIKSIDNGGIAVFGVNRVVLKGSEIQNNKKSGIYVDSDTAYEDAPVRMIIERSGIVNNGDVGIESRGDSVVTVLSTKVDGTCIESDDLLTRQKGIINVDGNEVRDGNCYYTRP